jgi:hypothetical protein
VVRGDEVAGDDLVDGDKLEVALGAPDLFGDGLFDLVVAEVAAA